MKHVIQITASGDIDEIQLLGEKPSEKELEALVGGTIQTLPAKYGVLVVNRDRETEAMPLNTIATDLLRGDVGDYICGDAVLAQYDGSRLIGFDSNRTQRIIDSLREGGEKR